MVTRRDYRDIMVAAARSVLIELTHLLKAYRREIVVVGGWVPELLISDGTAPHIGSTDVDLALDHRNLDPGGYETIRDLLLERSYRQGRQPFIYLRDVKAGGKAVTVQVDLLAGEYDGTGKGRRHQKVSDTFARKARGCDLAFLSPVEVQVDGTLPGGGKDAVVIRIASIVPFLTMKGMALDERLKEKDAWDIYYCVRHFQGGLDALVREFRPHQEHGLVREGLAKIERHFASTEHVGPKFVADFEELTDPEERDILQRDAFERISALLERLRVKP